jgi:hypothetical protein
MTGKSKLRLLLYTATFHILLTGTVYAKESGTKAGPPASEGAVAEAKPLSPLPMPAHPYQDNRGYAGAHADSYNSGVIAASGPVGGELEVHAYRTEQKPGFCSTQHFDLKGRVISICVGMKQPGKLVLLSPDNLEVLAEEPLPPMAGFYFRLDQDGRVVVPAGDMSVRVYEVKEGNGEPPSWSLVKKYDVSSAVPTALTGPMTLPLDIVADWKGNWWFAILKPAAIGYVTPGGKVFTHLFEDESIANGLASDPDGVFFVSNKKLYGMRAGPGGPEIFLETPYETGAGDEGPVGEGMDTAQQLDTGSGTTPVLFGKKLIAFGDTADPRPNAIVYRLDDVPDDQRLVCKVPLFKPGRSVLENSFIGYGNSVVVENNKGFKMGGDSSLAEPGFVRFDVREDLSGCDIVWENYEVRAGTGAKLSTGSGLIYVHELLKGTKDDWYLTALDFRTGEVAWRHYLGKGQDWDNALLTMSIGPDGLLTSGLFAGIVGARDAK